MTRISRLRAATRRLLALSLFSFALFVRASAHADPPIFSGQWERVFDKPVQCAAVDASNNLDVVITHPNGVSALLEQLDSSGNVAYTTVLYSGSFIVANAIATDPTGNIFVIGAFSGSMDIQGHTVITAGGKDIFVAAYTSEGAYRFIRHWGGGQDDVGTSIAIAPSGDVMIGGSTKSSTLDLGGAPMPSIGQIDAFLARLDASVSQVRWNERFSFSAYQWDASVAGIVVDGDDTADALIDFSAETGGGIGDFNYTASRILQFDPSGSQLWLIPLGSDANSILLAPSGNLDVIGNMVDCDYACVPVGNVSFAIQYLPDGSEVHGEVQNHFGAVAACNAGTIYVTGAAGAGMGVELATIDPTGVGTPVAVFPTSGASSGTFVHANGSGELWLTGIFKGTITLNGREYTAAVNQGFVIKGALNANAVAISSFHARALGNQTQLHASFQSNLTVESVNIYRAAANGPLLRIAEVLPRSDTFDYIDNTTAPGVTYRYQIGVIDGDGEFMSAIEMVTMPGIVTALQQNAPNPFNPVTTIRFSLTTQERARLRVYSAGGALVRTLLDETREAGHHNLLWDGRDDHGVPVGSGVYFCRLTAGKVSQSIRLVLLK